MLLWELSVTLGKISIFLFLLVIHYLLLAQTTGSLTQPEKTVVTQSIKVKLVTRPKTLKEIPTKQKPLIKAVSTKRGTPKLSRRKKSARRERIFKKATVTKQVMPTYLSTEQSIVQASTPITKSSAKFTTTTTVVDKQPTRQKRDRITKSTYQGNRLKPPYPRISRQRGEEGTVRLRVVVNVNGQPSSVTLAKSSNYSRLDNTAIQHVKQWRFVPATKNGEPVVDTVIVPIHFLLR